MEEGLVHFRAVRSMQGKNGKRQMRPEEKRDQVKGAWEATGCTLGDSEDAQGRLTNKNNM